jgi:uncharacterized protein YigA (DUF484 family)
LTQLRIPHQAGGAASLIERQVAMLRDKLKHHDQRLQSLLDIARDNERLAMSRHRIAVNLLGARDINDVVSSVVDELGNELKADFAVIKLFGNAEQVTQHPERYVERNSAAMSAFTTMLKHKNPVCGRSSIEQKRFLFGDDAEMVASAAVIPLVAGADLGLLGLGGREAARFNSSMGTVFLSQVGELVSAALAVHGGG